MYEIFKNSVKNIVSSTASFLMINTFHPVRMDAGFVEESLEGFI